MPPASGVAAEACKSRRLLPAHGDYNFARSMSKSCLIICVLHRAFPNESRFANRRYAPGTAYGNCLWKAYAKYV